MKTVILFGRILGRLGLGGIVGFIIFAVWYGGISLSPEWLVYVCGGISLIVLAFIVLAIFMSGIAEPLFLVAVSFLISKCFISLDWLETIGFPANLDAVNGSWIIHIFVVIAFYLILATLVAMFVFAFESKQKAAQTFVSLAACVGAFALAHYYII